MMPAETAAGLKATAHSLGLTLSADDFRRVWGSIGPLLDSIGELEEIIQLASEGDDPQ
jgi:hypothetical protein